MPASASLADKRGDFNVLLLQEWLSQSDVKALISDKLVTQQADREPYFLFAHCTEKTNKPTAEKEWQNVFSDFGLQLETVATGCCGMAGSYGHDAKNLIASVGIYAQSWQGALAERNTDRCLATGYSCRSQAKRVDEVQLAHPLMALLQRL